MSLNGMRKARGRWSRIERRFWCMGIAMVRKMKKELIFRQKMSLEQEIRAKWK